MSRTFTGRHMALILVAFFGVIAAVNFTMAKLAVGGFGGTIVDNSYVASQRYEEWREQARAQDAYGWTADARMDERGHVVVALDGAPGAVIGARAEHRYDRAHDVELVFEPTDGGFRSTSALGDGWYRLRLVVTSGEREARYLLDLGER